MTDERKLQLYEEMLDYIICHNDTDSEAIIFALDNIGFTVDEAIEVLHWIDREYVREVYEKL